MLRFSGDTLVAVKSGQVEPHYQELRISILPVMCLPTAPHFGSAQSTGHTGTENPSRPQPRSSNDGYFISLNQRLVLDAGFTVHKYRRWFLFVTSYFFIYQNYL